MAKELRGDLCIVASALKKVHEKDGEIDPDMISNFLTAGYTDYVFPVHKLLLQVLI